MKYFSLINAIIGFLTVIVLLTQANYSGSAGWFIASSFFLLEAIKGFSEEKQDETQS